MTVQNYKGIFVATGLIAGGAALFFARTNKAHVTAPDVAEPAAGIVERKGEQTGGTNIPSLFYTREWHQDTNVVANWGGYSSLTITFGASPPSPNVGGVYKFWKRVNGTIPNVSGTTIMADVIDVYTNMVKVSSLYRFLFDCGPNGGLSPTHTPRSWILASGGNTFSTSPTSATPYTLTHFTPGGRDLTTTNFFAWATADTATFSDTAGYVNGFRFVLSATSTISSNVRTYCPRVLISYTNTIGLTPDKAVITAIRNNTISICSNSAWIGPTNADLNYDGVADFPLVKTSEWFCVYRAWYTNHTVFTNSTAVPTNNGTATNYVIHVYTNENLGQFITTNELAWHYSALARLRDMTWTDGVSSNVRARFVASANIPGPLNTANANAGFTAAYALLQGYWAAGGVRSYIEHTGVFTNDGDTARGFFWCETSGPIGGGYQYNVSVDMCVAQYQVDGHWTNTLSAKDWMIYAHDGQNVVGGLGGVIPMRWHDYSGQVYSNRWACWGQDAAKVDKPSFSSASVGAMTLPPLSDLNIDNGANAFADGVGWYDDNSAAILRWQQAACSNAIFDGRYQ